MILVNQVKIPKNAKKYLNDCVESTWISGQGKYVEKFEKEFAKFIGKKYAVSTNSGTSALHLALLALDIKAGDEVILPALTIGSCYFAIWQTGAKAVPIDVLPDTYNINPSLIEKNINNKTKAIIPVHLYGEACEMDSILKIAKKYRLKVVEDAAEAHGAIYKNKKLGSFGDLACFSFYANKLITTGEGGAVLTDNKKMCEKMQRLKNLNFSQQKRFVHRGIGYKYELSNLEAALGLASLEEVERNLSLKTKMASYYDDQLNDVPGIITPVKRTYTQSSYWMYAILVKKEQFGVSKRELMKILLNKYDIQTREFFYPPQIAFKKMNLYANENFPVAEKLSAEGLYLPSGLGNTKEDFQKVVAAIKQIHADAKRKIY